MKKLLRVILPVVLVASLVLIFTGCAEDEKSKTYNALSQAFSGDNYIVSFEEEGVSTITLAVKGENIYMDVKESETSIAVVYKDNTTYVISHDDKMYMASEGKNEQMLSEDMGILSKEDLKEFETAEYEKGKEQINGTEYEYEQYNGEEGVTERYYFEGNDLKYIKTIQEGEEDLIVKVLKLSSEVDDSVFEIPSDYEKIEM